MKGFLIHSFDIQCLVRQKIMFSSSLIVQDFSCFFSDLCRSWSKFMLNKHYTKCEISHDTSIYSSIKRKKCPWMKKKNLHHHTWMHTEKIIFNQYKAPTTACKKKIQIFISLQITYIPFLLTSNVTPLSSVQQLIQNSISHTNTFPFKFRQKKRLSVPWVSHIYAKWYLNGNVSQKKREYRL